MTSILLFGVVVVAAAEGGYVAGQPGVGGDVARRGVGDGDVLAARVLDGQCCELRMLISVRWPASGGSDALGGEGAFRRSPDEGGFRMSRREDWSRARHTTPGGESKWRSNARGRASCAARCARRLLRAGRRAPGTPVPRSCPRAATARAHSARHGRPRTLAPGTASTSRVARALARPSTGVRPALSLSTVVVTAARQTLFGRSLIREQSATSEAGTS